jgi:mannose-6-phosphate isomerase class I
MEKAPYDPPTPETLERAEGLVVERIVDFPQFVVERVALELNRSQKTATQGNNQYQLLVVTLGKGELILPDNRTVPLEPEGAYLLPAALGSYTVNAIAAQGVTYLKCSPRLSANKEAPEVRVTVEDALERTW